MLQKSEINLKKIKTIAVNTNNSINDSDDNDSDRNTLISNDYIKDINKSNTRRTKINIDINNIRQNDISDKNSDENNIVSLIKKIILENIDIIKIISNLFPKLLMK